MRRCFRRDKTGSTALEFALVFPSFLLMMLGLIMIYTLIATKRAIDYGIDKALRSAAVNSAGGASAMTTAFSNAASVIWTAAGTGSTVTVSVNPGGTGTLATASTFSPGDVVQISVSFNWVASAGLASKYANRIFNPATLSSNGSVRVIN